jgi:nucleotide sugar dehydrogenase
MKNKSISLINKKEYFLPEKIDDKLRIDNFLEANKCKKVIVIQGLGFVGTVMSLIVANALTEEYAVIGIDLANEQSFWKICSLNEGVFPILSSDPKVELFYQNALRKGNLLATFDPYAYSKADVIIVDINLDVAKGNNLILEEIINYDVDLTAFKKGINSIAEYCKEDVLILVETTVPPGTCINIVKPAIDKKLKERKLNNSVKIGHSYERVMPGPNYIDSIQNFYRVYSGVDAASADSAEYFLKTIIKTDSFPLTRLGSTNATETAKVMENSFRAMNIAFLQEWTELAESAGINLQEVVSAIRMRSTHQNMMLPGLGVGGYCLTKDPLLASWAASNFFGASKLVFSEKAVQTNDYMPAHSVKRIKKLFPSGLKNKKILLLGISYLGNVGDTRYSPVQMLYENLLNEGTRITLHDPYISWWEEMDLKVFTELEAVTNDNYDLIVFSTKHDTYFLNEGLDKWLSEQNTIIYDSNLVLDERKINLYKINNTVKIVGRGDI